MRNLQSYKNTIILLGAFLVALLVSAPRILITLRESQIAEQYGMTIMDIGVRMMVLFCFAWMILSFNLKWKHRFLKSEKRNWFLASLPYNLVLTFFFVFVFILLKVTFSPGFLELRGLIVITLSVYLIVLSVLLITSRLVNITIEYQQNLIDKEQAKQESLQHQLAALRNQVNPHFLFNTLNSLKALILEGSGNAPTFVDKLSFLLRQTLQSSEKDYVSLAEELKYLEAYIFLQKERFGEKLEVNINLEKGLEKEQIPSFSLQLLVENAIKHNVISQKQPLRVDIFQEDNYLVVRNPIQKRRDSVESTGKGLHNLTNRFLILRKEPIQISQTDQYFTVKLPIHAA